MEFGYENYYEPDAYDMFMAEFTDKIRTAMTEEAKKLVEGRQKENEALREKVKELESSLYAAKRELEKPKQERAEIERQVRRERLSVLMGDMKVFSWVPGIDYQVKPKCDKCNDARMIAYTLPSGKVGYEQCECAARRALYVAEEHVIYEFKLDRHSSNEMVAWYEVNPASHGASDDYGRISKVFKGYSDHAEDYSLVNRHDAIFKEKEKCQAYCDWINSQS